MSLPYVIQYLESLKTAQGGQLVEPGGFQIYIPSVPPNIQVTYQIVPATGYYAYIGYRLSFDPAMVPLAWRMTIAQWGAQPYTGVLSGDILRDGLEHILVVTVAHPCITYATNLTALNQYACVNGLFVSVANEDDFNTTMDYLEKLGTADATTLLKQMVAAQMPKPPATGGG